MRTYCRISLSWWCFERCKLKTENIFMIPDIQQLRKNYERFDNDELTRLASEEAVGLRPEALDLLKQIIKERGLPDTVLKSIDVQFQNAYEKELSLVEYANILRSLPCPVCGGESEKLNLTVAHTVISYIVMTSSKKEIVIACPDCLDKKNDDAIFKTAVLGWWGFPWGFFRTPRALWLNWSMKKGNRVEEANNHFTAFVAERAGRIKAIKNDPERLSLMIKHIR